MKILFMINKNICDYHNQSMETKRQEMFLKLQFSL